MSWLHTIIISISWTIAVVLFFSRTASVSGLVAAAGGVFVGIFSERLACISYDSDGRSKISASGIWIRISAVAITLLSSFFSIKLIQFLPGNSSFLLSSIEAINLFLKTFAICFFFRSLTFFFAPLISIEVAVIVFLTSGVMAEYRNGRISQPYWLMDWLTENGYRLDRILWSFAIPLLALILAIFFEARSRKLSLRSLLALIFTLPLLSLFTYACITFILPAMPITSDKVPPPPLPPSSEPPPPPTPEKIAFVKIDSAYKPPERFGAFYFRAEVREKLDNWDFIPQSTTSGDLWTSFPASGSKLRPPWKGGADVVKAKKTNEEAISPIVTSVFMFNKDIERPLSLISPISFQTIEIPDKRFSRAYRIESMAPGLGSMLDDINLQGFRQSLEDPSWTPEKKAFLTSVPDDRRLVELSNALTSEIPDRRRRFLVPRVAAVISYLNKHGSYSARKGKELETEDVDKFLFGDIVGGSRQFAVSAVLLLRSSGVPARLASGYRVERPPDEETEKILITQAHWAEWPEIYLSGTGWLPLMIAPEKVLDRESPPPENDIEELLSEVASNTISPLSSSSESGDDIIYTIIRWSLLFPLSALVFYVLAKLWVRYVAIWAVRRDQELMRIRAMESALELILIGGFFREYGQTYMMLAESMISCEKRGVMRIGEAFREICKMSRNVYLRRARYSFWDWNKALFVLSVSITKGFFFTPRNFMQPGSLKNIQRNNWRNT